MSRAPSREPRLIWDNRVEDRRDLLVRMPEGVQRLMLVPDEMRKGVVFIYRSTGGELKPAGTGFFLVKHDKESGHNVAILMTARHVVVGVEILGDDDTVHLRVNKKGGGSFWYPIPLGEWLMLEDLDVAFAPWSHLADADYRAWSIEPNTATAETMRSEGIGVGDEVFMVGLFRNHLGKDQNEPIIRVGNIASIPADGVRIRGMGRFPPLPQMPTILVEARSIGGLSGSPVYVHMGWSRWREGSVATSDVATPFFWLGVMHGHWDMLPDDAEGPPDVTQERIHSGIGIVVPADAIMARIRPILEAALKVKSESQQADEAPTQDAIEDGTTEFARFADLLGKVVQVPKDEADEIHRRHQE